jgi:hypothetical protein
MSRFICQRPVRRDGQRYLAGALIEITDEQAANRLLFLGAIERERVDQPTSTGNAGGSVVPPSPAPVVAAQPDVSASAAGSELHPADPAKSPGGAPESSQANGANPLASANDPKPGSEIAAKAAPKKTKTAAEKTKAAASKKTTAK